MQMQQEGSSQRSRQRPGLDVNNWSAINAEIKAYLEVRKQLNLPPLKGESRRLGDRRKASEDTNDNPLSSSLKDAAAMGAQIFRPTGWYKDDDAIDLKKRTDSRSPFAIHPLSYLELQRHGFESLGDAVMTLGGPYIVGERFGLEWEEEIEDLSQDESLRSVRIESYALDSRGSLLLGGALGSKLDMDAAALDMASLKKEIEARQNANDDDGDWVDVSNRRREGARSSVVSTEGEEYKDITFKQRFGKQAKGPKTRPSWADEEKIVPKGERFTLESDKRLYLALSAATFSLANGHTSNDMI